MAEYNEKNLVKQVFDEDPVSLRNDLKNIVSNLPAGKRMEGTEKADKLLNQRNYLSWLVDVYKNIKLKKGIFAEYASHMDNPGTLKLFLQGHPDYGRTIKNKDDFLKVYRKINEAENKYMGIWKKATEYTAQIARDLENLEKKYSLRGMQKESTHAEHWIVTIILSGFALSVLYALSHMNPQTVTGNFFLEEGSPTLIAMLTGVVVFVLFFLTHHKLK